MDRPLVAIFGSSSGDDADLERARALGRDLAEAGYGIINGGYGGTMEASARGARESGGSAIGVTCAPFSSFRAGPNPYCDEVVEAPTLLKRIEELVTRPAAYIILPGGNGTLAELAIAWEHQRRRLLPDRPIIVWEHPWRNVLGALREGGYVGGGDEETALVWVEDVPTAVEVIRQRVPVEA
jgi:uncharacterized protein (TIGR00730 family)